MVPLAPARRSGAVPEVREDRDRSAHDRRARAARAREARSGVRRAGSRHSVSAGFEAIAFGAEAIREATPVAPGPDPFADDVAGGDLQIDLSDAIAPKPGLARPPTPGVGFNPFDDDIGAGPAIELDVSNGASLPPRASSPQMNAASIPAAPVSAPRSLAPTSQPSAPALPPSKPPVDPFDARAYADYGAPPDAFWRAPLYAYRVATRRGQLVRDLAAKRAENELTTKRVEDALVAFGERARALAKGGAALDRVNEAEALLKARDGALATTTDAHHTALGEIDAKVAAASAELAHLQNEEARVQAERDAAEDDQKRTDAKIKRIDIEIRNGAQNRAQERDALAAELAPKTQRRNDAEQALALAKQKTTAAQQKSAAAIAERNSQEGRYARQAGVRTEGSSDAQRHLRAALVELGRAMLADVSVADLGAARDEIARLETQAQQKVQDLTVHETAINAYDKGKVFLGVALVVIAAFLVIGILAFPFIYSSFAPSTSTP